MPVLWGFRLFECQEQGRVKVSGWQRCSEMQLSWQGDGPIPAKTQNLPPCCGSVTPLLPSPFLPHHNALSQPKKLFSSHGAHEIASVVSIRSQPINNQPFKISSPVSEMEVALLAPQPSSGKGLVPQRAAGRTGPESWGVRLGLPHMPQGINVTSLFASLRTCSREGNTSRSWKGQEVSQGCSLSARRLL